MPTHAHPQAHAHPHMHTRRHMPTPAHPQAHAAHSQTHPRAHAHTCTPAAPCPHLHTRRMPTPAHPQRHACHNAVAQKARARDSARPQRVTQKAPACDSRSAEPFGGHEGVGTLWPPRPNPAPKGTTEQPKPTNPVSQSLSDVCIIVSGLHEHTHACTHACMHARMQAHLPLTKASMLRWEARKTVDNRAPTSRASTVGLNSAAHGKTWGRSMIPLM
jgi:hypothetical protein